MRYSTYQIYALLAVILTIFLIGCAEKEKAAASLNLPDFLANFERENSRIKWYATDFEYVRATINTESGATVITINLSSGSAREINGGEFFSNVLFQNNSVPKILRICDPSSQPCINSSWAYEKNIGYNTFTTAYCPSSQQFCQNVVNYYFNHSTDCGAIDGIDMRCLNESWDKDLGQVGKLGRIIK